ncbi:MAG: hypothetical protein A49_12260 [Methyloceanibacter sp.]|nr:MAG: hypothetical protein A49_12260 [Methyloceanibacter sp.]
MSRKPRAGGGDRTVQARHGTGRTAKKRATKAERLKGQSQRAAAAATRGASAVETPEPGALSAAQGTPQASKRSHRPTRFHFQIIRFDPSYPCQSVFDH